MFKLASLFVDITAKDDQFQKQIGGVQRQLSLMGTAIGVAGGNLVSSAIASATSGLAGFLSRGIAGSIELQDQLSALTAVFGDAASAITGEADVMAKKFGVVKGEFIGAATTFGQMFKGAGSSQAEAAALGNQLTELGMDMKSFKGGLTTNQDAFTALAAAMRGENDPIEKFGVFLSAAKIEQEAFTLGLAKNSKEIDDHAKKQATLSLIMKQTADQQGDLAKTADQTGNSWSKVTGTLQNTAVTIGDALTPAVDAVVKGLGAMATSISDWVDSSKERIKSFAEATVQVFTVSVPNAWDTFIAGLAVASFKVEEWAANTMAVLATVPENLSRIAGYIQNNWRKMVTDALNAVGIVFHNLGDNLGRLAYEIKEFLSGRGFHFEWKGLLDEFKATADQLPELLKPNLVSMDAQIAAVGENLNQKMQARAKAANQQALDALAPAKAVAAAVGKKTADFKSETLGSAEFALKMRSNILGGSDDTAKKQLDVQKKIAESTQATAAAIVKKKWGLA